MFEVINLEKTSGVICPDDEESAGRRFRSSKCRCTTFIARSASRSSSTPPHRQDGHRRDAPVVVLVIRRQHLRQITGGWSPRGCCDRRDGLTRATAAAASWSRAAWVIGSNLARRLVDLEADVLLVDSLTTTTRNLFNIDGVADRLRVNVADIRQQSTMNYLVRDREVIFNPPARSATSTACGTAHGSRDQLPQPARCSKGVPQPQRRGEVVFAALGRSGARPLPVSEAHLVRPTDINGINKAAGGITTSSTTTCRRRVCSLRLTNAWLAAAHQTQPQGFIGWFIWFRSKAMDPDIRRRFAAPHFVHGRRGRRVSRAGPATPQRRGVNVGGDVRFTRESSLPTGGLRAPAAYT